MAFGIPSADQINSLVEGALSRVDGLEKQTAADMQAVIARGISNLLEIEAKVQGDVEEETKLILSRVDKFQASVDELISLVQQGFSISITLRPTPPKA